MTPNQLKAVKSSPSTHLLVLGPAGSGKTQLLLHRAAYIKKENKLSSLDYRIFVLSEMVREFIKREVRQIGLSEEVVYSFNHWCREFYEQHISLDLPRTYINLRVDYKRIRKEVLEFLKKRKELYKSLKFVMIDDGQNLEVECYQILNLISKHVTVVADFQQKIIPNNTSESFILECLKSPCKKLYIPELYKNSPSIINLASYFIVDKDICQQYRSGFVFSSGEGDLPLCYIASSFKEELDHLAETVKMRQLKKEKVGIVVPNDRLVHGLAPELNKRGVKVEKVIEPDAQNVIHEPYDFENDLPKITSFSKVIGLTFDSLFIPQLKEEYFSTMRDEYRIRTLFMGLVRARKWVYLSTVRGEEIKEIDLLRKAREKGYVLML